MASTDEFIASNRRRGLALFFHWLLRPLGYLEVTDIYKLHLRNLPPLFDVPGYRIVQADAADIADIKLNIKRDEPSHVIDALWRNGHHCFVAKTDRGVVAYNWIAFSRVQEEEYTYEPRPEHAICLDAFTRSDHRGKSLHPLLLLSMLHFAASSGKTCAYTGASLYNVVSWKTHIRMGWRREFSFVWFRPYWTLRRLPWTLTKSRYPVRLDWTRHSWFHPEPPEPDSPATRPANRPPSG